MKAKEAFDSVCTKIAEKYKDDGWKYSKSNHWMTWKDKNFKATPHKTIAKRCEKWYN